MKKQLIALFVICVMLFSLSSCGLAKPKSDTDIIGDEDRLVGIALTFQDVDPDTRVEAVLTANDSGNSVFTFPGIDGYLLYAAQLNDTVGCYGDQVFADLHFSVGSSTLLDATLYAQPEEEQICYVCTIYQRPDGTAYLLREAGAYQFTSLSEVRAQQNLAEAVSGSSTTTIYEIDAGGLHLEERDSHTQSNTTASGTKVTVHIEPRQEASRFVLLQMSGDNRVLSETTYLPGQLPVELALNRDCAYLILESHEDEVVRTLIDAGTEHLFTWAPDRDNLFLSHSTRLIWPE